MRPCPEGDIIQVLKTGRLIHQPAPEHFHAFSLRFLSSSLLLAMFGEHGRVQVGFSAGYKLGFRAVTTVAQR